MACGLCIVYGSEDSFDGKAGSVEEDIRLRKPEAIAAYQEQLSAEIDFMNFCSICSPDSGPD